MAISIAQLSAEHHHSGFGLFTKTPRLSWRFNATTAKGWKQAKYEITVSRQGKEESYQVDSNQSLLVPWPAAPLSSREQASVRVRATGIDGSTTDWASLNLEVALLDRSEWQASLISGEPQGPEPKRPFRLRKAFTWPGSGSARLYATSHGMYEVEINDKSVGDQVLAPGWQSYHHRLHYQTYDITGLLQHGTNVIGAHVAEGWYATRLGRPGVPNQWGERPAFLAQVEADGQVICVTDSSWEIFDSPLLNSELYNGETCDTNLLDESWSTTASTIHAKSQAEELPFPSAELISSEVAPVRTIMELKAKELIITPSGKKILDFGQNFVGWLRFEKDVPGTPNDEIIIRHAEVLEHGELGTRPLRTADAKYTVKLGGPTKGLHAKFSFFGFRYVIAHLAFPQTLGKANE